MEALLDFGMRLFVFLMGLAALIFVHELGHFLFARRFGVVVEKFALGFGPKLIGFTKGGTEYLIAAIPLSLLAVGFDLDAVTSLGYGALVYAALVGTFGGTMLAFYNIKRFGATASSMTAYVVPVVANIGGILFLDEIFTRGMLAGTGLIVLGIYIINRRQKAVSPK